MDIKYERVRNTDDTTYANTNTETNKLSFSRTYKNTDFCTNKSAHNKTDSSANNLSCDSHPNQKSDCCTDNIHHPIHLADTQSDHHADTIFVHPGFLQ
jgi:hypothetical protein